MPHKYRAINCRQRYPECEQGHASLKEHRRAQELRLLERAGEIRNLREQVAIQLAPAVVIDGRKKPALRYVADFVYEEQVNYPGGLFREVIEDCKGIQTPAFRIKAHLMAAQGITVRLT